MCAAAAMFPAAAVAQVDACSPRIFRWAEDCRNLAALPRKGTDILRYIPIDDDGDVWVTLGGEFRLRPDTLQDPDFGIGSAPSFTSITSRAYVHADLRTRGGARVFAQLSGSAEDGRLPGPRSVDTSGPDIAQLFVDLPLGPLLVRIGRQEIDLGGNRLVSLRDAALRRSFDGVQLQLAIGGAKLTAIRLQPVVITPRSFDDRRDRGDTFAGASLALPMAHNTNVTLFAFDRRRAIARTFSASGREERQTYGARAAWRDHGRDATLQIAVQEGSLAGQPILAWGGTLDAGQTLRAPGQPRIGVSLGYASGDARAGDGKIGSFDPIYPNLSVYTEAPLYFPVNQINAEVNVSIRPTRRLALKLNGILLARASGGDAVYAASGRPLIGPGRDRLSGTAAEMTARWTVNRHIEFYGAVVHAFALSAIEAAGGRDADYALLQATARF